MTSGMRPLSIIRIFICVFGLLGNVPVILVLLFTSDYKKRAFYWYVFHLAISDTFFLSTIPFKVHSSDYGWHFGLGACKLVEGVVFINYYSSIMFLVIMSLDRCVAVCFANHSLLRKLQKLSSAYVISALIWIVAILLSTPGFYFSNVKTKNNSFNCINDFPSQPVEDQSLSNELDTAELDGMTNSDKSLDDFSGLEEKKILGNLQIPTPQQAVSDGFQAYVWFNFIAMYITPLILLLVCYGWICWKFWKTRVPEQKSTSKTVRDRRRVTVVCIILVASFMSCWLMYHLTTLMFIRGERNNEFYRMVGLTLGFLNSALNPFLYTFLGTEFRRRLRLFRKRSSTRFRLSTKTKNTALGSFSFRNKNALSANLRQQKNSIEKKQSLEVAEE